MWIFDGIVYSFFRTYTIISFTEYRQGLSNFNNNNILFMTKISAKITDTITSVSGGILDIIMQELIY